MVQEQLSIKVRVDLPAAGELENQPKKNLRGMKDIEADVKVKPKLTGLKNLKSQIQKSINGGNLQAKVGVKVTGEAQLARLAREMEKVRRLANQPLKFSIDTGNAKFDEQINKARKGVGELERAYSDRAGIGLRKQVEAARRSMEQSYSEMQKANLNAVKATNDKMAQVYRDSAQQHKSQLQKDIAEYRRLSEDAGIGRKEINKQIRNSTTPTIKDQTAERLARTRREVSAAAADWKRYGAAMKEAYAAEQKLAKGQVGRNERSALADRAKARRQEAEAIRLSADYQERANRAEARHQQNLRMINARRLDGAYATQSRRTRTRGGIVPTMDIGGALMTGAMGIASIVSQYNDLDKAITKVTKVVPDSQAAVNKWKRNIYKDASEVGKSAPEFAAAVEQWATAGYNLKQSNRLAKQSVMGAFVGEVPVNDMVKYMSVPMKAFQKEGIKSTDILNAMNEVSNKHAIEMDDLGAAYQKASSTVGATGTKFSQLTGIITAAQEGTRAGGDAIGTAYKTIGSRIAKMGTGLTKQDQTRAAFFKSLGVNLTDTNGKLKSTWDVMDQLGKKWNTLSEQDKNTAAQYAAGANHANIFQATMDNWKTARKAMREAEDQQGLGSSGSAYQEMAKQKQSVEFQLVALQNMWGQFVENITGGRKGISEMLGLVNFLGGGLLKLSSNPFLSSATRWGTVAAGMLMARRAMGSLATSLGSVILQGKKGDGVLERLTGISSKTQNMKDKWADFKNAVNDARGKNTPAAKTQASKNIEALRNNPAEGYSTETETLKKNTQEHERNNSARQKRSRSIQSESDVTQNNIRALGGNSAALANNTKKTSDLTMKTSKLGKMANVAKAGLGVVSAGLGYVGLALDAVTIAGMAMNAMGIHPIQALQKAMDPAGESAKRLDKYIGKVGRSVEKTSSAIESNGIVTGQLTADLKSVGDMKKALGSLQVQDGKYTGDNFEQLKKNFNEIAKHNGLELRIRGGESVDAINGKVEALNNNMDNVKKESALDLGKNISKNIDNVNSLLNTKSFNKLLSSNKAYNKDLDKLKDNYNLADIQFNSARWRKAKANLRDQYSWGGKNGALWNSSEGKKIQKEVNAAQRSIRDGIDSMASALNDGTLSVDNLRSMNGRGREAGALALVKNLQGLRGSNDQGKKDNITKQLGQVLNSASQKQIQNIAKYADKEYSNGKLLGALSKAGVSTELLASTAGIGAQAQNQYSMRYGKNWIGKAAEDQIVFDKFHKKHQGATNVESLVDPNTGFLNYNRIAKFNSGRATYGSGQRRLKGTGFKYGRNKPLSGVDIANATMGLDGDAITILNDITDGKGTVEQIAAVTNNNHKKYDKNGNVVKGSGATGQQMVDAVATASNGKKNLSQKEFDSSVDQMRWNNEITGDQATAMKNARSKNYDKNGRAKNLNAALKQIGDHGMTADSFKDYAKNLDKNARQQLAKKLKETGQLGKKDYDELTKENGFVDQGKKPSKTQKNNKPSSNKDKGDDNGSGRSGSKPKSKPSPPKNLKDFLLGGITAGVAGTDGRVGRPGKSLNPFKGFHMPNLSKLNPFKGIHMPNLSKLNPFKGFHMPNLSKLNPLKGFKMPKISLPKGLNSNPFKNWKMPKGISNFKLPKGLSTNPFKNWKPPKGLDNLFKGGKNDPLKGLKSSWDKLFGGKGKNNKIKVDADTKSAEQKVKKLGKGSGKDKTKVKVDADTKNAESKIKKLGKNGGKNKAKIKVDAETKGAESKIKRLGKNNKNKVKIKTDADTKGAEAKLKSLSKGNKNKVKIKTDADTKGAESKLKNVGKNAKAKVKVDADTKGAESKVKNVGKNAKAKVKVDADTSGVRGKITSAVRGIDAKVKVSADPGPAVSKIKGALNGLTATVKINASGNALSTINQVKSALGGLHDKSITITANDNATGPINKVKSARDSLHDKRFTVTADVGQALGALNQVKGLLSSIEGTHTASVVVNKTVNISEKHSKSGSVGIAVEDVNQPINPLRSMSVVAGNPTLAGMIDSSASSMGIASDINSAMNGQKVTDYSDSTQKVNEDYWRYMGNELYTGLPLDEQVNKLESAVTEADDNMDKLIDLARQRIDLDNRQINYQKTMQSAYQQQITDMINELHKYGFQNNGNTITNLGHARDITGDNASKVDELLGKYQSAYQNFSQATQKIQELQTDIWQQGKNQEDYRNTKDQKMVEQLQRELELVNTSIENQKSILERQDASLTDSDYRMKLKNSSDQIYAKTEAVQQLLGEFNHLSMANFVGTKDADNAKNLADSLSSIKGSIMDNLDAIDELKKNIRDIKLNSLIENVTKFTDNLNTSIDRLKNNVTNLQDGLLSGTTYSNLMSSDLDVVNLKQKGAYEKGVEDKIKLERELDSVLDQFARKNVDRTAQVANAQLQIEAQKYNDMLSMATSYARGTRWESSPIVPQYNISTESDKIETPDITHNEEYLKASVEYQKELNKLKQRYNEQMASADSAESRQLINQRMVYEQLMLQERVYNTMIETDKQAISELRKQLSDPDMNSDQLKTINNQITEYENNIIEAQNNIKEAVKGRYEYEKTLLDREIDQYQRLSDTMSNLVTIADALHLSGDTQAKVIDQRYAATYLQYENYLDILAKLREERSQFEKGSFEWNQLESMIQEYQPALESIVTSLFEINKSEFEQKLRSVQEYFEKNVNEGKTADQAKFDQDVWYNPVQKELKLEEMRLKIVELEDKTIEKRIAALDAQERMSKAEADYVDKQLDLALAQQKLNNTINKKDVRYLEKDENGKFNWTYIADQEQVDAARQEVNKAKQEIENAKVSNRNDYIEKVEKIMSDMKDGSYNQEEARKRLEQLNDSYKFILKDIPTFDISKVEDILQAYNDYEQKNQNILNDYHRNANVQNKASYQEIIDGFGEQFKMVSKDLGEIFGKQLHDALNLPNGIRNAYGNGTDNSLTINGDLRVELPDVSNVDDFAKAIATLPQVARQKATSK